MPNDPYTTLGVSKDASPDDVKKAYRKMAHQYHPDKKGGDEAKFKEVNEAYQTLSDPDKKARYDRFGHMGGSAGGGPQGYQDINFDFGGGGFESIFDMFTGGASSAPRRATKGEDLHLEVKVGSGDLGKPKVYEFQAFNACTACTGTGARDGKLKECPTCHGQGRVQKAVRTPFGTFAQVGVCSECEGDGEVPEHVCDVCSGVGRTKGKRTLEVRLPMHVEDRYLMAFPQEGNAGPKGVPSGDLLVTLRMK